MNFKCVILMCRHSVLKPAVHRYIEVTNESSTAAMKSMTGTACDTAEPTTHCPIVNDVCDDNRAAETQSLLFSVDASSTAVDFNDKAKGDDNTLRHVVDKGQVSDGTEHPSNIASEDVIGQQQALVMNLGTTRINNKDEDTVTVDNHPQPQQPMTPVVSERRSMGSQDRKTGKEESHFFNIMFTEAEFTALLSCEKEVGFISGWTDAFYSKFHVFWPSCALTTIRNRFKTPDARKGSCSPYWKGQFRCRASSNCVQVFMVIEDKPLLDSQVTVCLFVCLLLNGTSALFQLK